MEFDRSLAWGGRAGRFFYFSVTFLGLGLDFFRYYPYLGPQSVQLRGCFYPGGCGTKGGGTGSFFHVETTALSVDLMLRLPLLKSEDAPHGRVQPYVAVGPPLFMTTITPRHTRSFRNHDSDTDFSFGYKLAGGVAVQIVSSSPLGEYRFTHVSPRWSCATPPTQDHAAGGSRHPLRPLRSLRTLVAVSRRGGQVLPAAPGRFP